MELNTTNPHCFTYKTDELLIELLGGVRIDTLDRMRAFKDTMQLVSGDAKRVLIEIEGGYFKGTFLQATIHNRKAVVLPHQQLDVCARPIDEDEHIAGHDFLTQFILNDAAEAVEAFTHIGLSAIQMITTLIAQVNNRTHYNNSLRNDALTG